MNYYKKYPADYLAKTLHLSMEQDGAYNRLLDWCYANGADIPHAQRYIIARAMKASEKRAVDTVMAEFFTRNGDTWGNGRARREMDHAAPAIEAARENGKRGGRPRKEKPSGFLTENPLGYETETQLVSKTKASHIPETKEQDQKQDQKQKPPARASAHATPVVKPAEVQDSTWGDWLALRKAKRAPVTQTVLRGANREAAKAGMPLDAFLAEWCERGSQGLKADWIKGSEKRDGRKETLSTADVESGLRQWLDAKRGNAGVHLGEDGGAVRTLVDETAPIRAIGR